MELFNGLQNYFGITALKDDPKSFEDYKIELGSLDGLEVEVLEGI